MKAIVKVKQEVDVAFLDVMVQVRYGTEDMPADFPGRNGDVWSARIDVDSGVIQGWPLGRTGSFDMKVVDTGTYKLIGRSGEALAEKIGDYVPNHLIPGEYGDYINLEINEAGRITNWPSRPSLEDFFPDN